MFNCSIPKLFNCSMFEVQENIVKSTSPRRLLFRFLLFRFSYQNSIPIKKLSLFAIVVLEVHMDVLFFLRTRWWVTIFKVEWMHLKKCTPHESFVLLQKNVFLSSNSFYVYLYFLNFLSSIFRELHLSFRYSLARTQLNQSNSLS